MLLDDRQDLIVHEFAYGIPHEDLVFAEESVSVQIVYTLEFGHVRVCNAVRSTQKERKKGAKIKVNRLFLLSHAVTFELEIESLLADPEGFRSPCPVVT